MTDRFRSFQGLLDAVEARDFDRPPAFVANAHVTGLGVARALDRHDVPVVALDRVGDGVAPGSTAVDLAGRVTYPLDDLDSFREDVEALAAAVDHEPVAFGCMDEWVHAFVRARPEGVALPFDADAVDAVLDKESLYALARDLDVPVPETYRIAGPGRDGRVGTDGGEVAGKTDTSEATGDPLPVVAPDEAAETLGFPLVVKPALKREFEEAVGTNVVEVGSREEFDEMLEEARAADVRVMAQRKVAVATGEDCSLASYVPPDGDPLWVVGNAAVRYPRGYGTSCVVDRVERPALAERALSVLDASGYHGISESEFVYDDERETFVLLDVNTRPWKWIAMPVAAGANLPMAAYASVTGADYEPRVEPGRPEVDADSSATGGDDGEADSRASADATGIADPAGTDATPSPTRWVYLRDYLALLGEAPDFADVLDDEQWTALLSGAVEERDDLVAGVYRPADPDPALDLLRTEFSAREYYCAC